MTPRAQSRSPIRGRVRNRRRANVGSQGEESKRQCCPTKAPATTAAQDTPERLESFGDATFMSLRFELRNSQAEQGSRESTKRAEPGYDWAACDEGPNPEWPGG